MARIRCSQMGTGYPSLPQSNSEENRCRMDITLGQVDTQKILHRVLQKVRSITLIRFYTLWNCQQHLSVEGGLWKLQP